MAKLTISLCLLMSAVLLSTTHASAMAGRKVGGRRQVKNVKENKEVQELGRYCVEEYNQQLHQKGNGSSTKLLLFSEVVEAETQVVSGIKYYLTISASTRNGGAPRTFEAVVVVKAWMHSKELLDFAPSPRPTNTK